MFHHQPEVKEAENEEANSRDDSSDSLLDFNDLDIDFLAEDWDDGGEDLEFNELDMDLLDVDFLQDVLKLFEEVNILKQKQRDKGWWLVILLVQLLEQR